MRTVIAIDEIPAQTGLGADGTPDRTVVTLDRGIGHHDPDVLPAAAGVRCYHLPVRARCSGTRRCATPTCRSRCVSASSILTPTPTTGSSEGPYRDAEPGWVDHDLPAGTTELWLDRIVPEITTDSWIVLSRAGYRELYLVTATEEGNRNAFLLSGPATRLTISGENTDRFSHPQRDGVRRRP